MIQLGGDAIDPGGREAANETRERGSVVWSVSAVGLSGHAKRLICSGHFPASLPPMIVALQLASFESHQLMGAPSREKSLAPLTAAGQTREKTARRPRRSACLPLLATAQSRCHLI